MGMIDRRTFLGLGVAGVLALGLWPVRVLGGVGGVGGGGVGEFLGGGGGGVGAGVGDGEFLAEVGGPELREFLQRLKVRPFDRDYLFVKHNLAG
ncbi:MAG: hypothetical protein ACOX51_03490 [Myxococcota bacterium]